MADAADKTRSPEASFREQLREQAAGEAIGEHVRTDLSAFADGLWSWASQLEPGAREVRIRRVENGSLLEASAPDMPFLVDSLLAECAAQHLGVTALLHPIVDMENGERRSIIQILLPALDENEGAAIDLGARRTIDDIALAVSDYPAMRARMREEIETLTTLTHLPEARRDEGIAFLEWLANDHFVFLGARTYSFALDDTGALSREEPEMVEGSNLGLLRDEARNILSRDSEPLVITSRAAQYLQQPDPVIIAKASLLSRVHRRVNADYIGVKHYDDEGRVVGETRFAGLFTAEAYNEAVHSIPVVRRRVARIIDASGAREGGHSAKALTNILETWPRDELFQLSADELKPMALGALSLVGRPRTRVFLRKDRFDRYVTALVYLSREAYDTALRQKITDALERACNGKLVSFQPRFGDGQLMQVYFVLVPAGETGELNHQEIESVIGELARTWDDSFRTAISLSDLEGEDRHGAMCFRGAFNAAYREAFSPGEALLDVSEMAALHKDNLVRMRAYRSPGDDADKVRAKIYARGSSIPLSACVPVFENMGLFVAFETGYPVVPERKPVPDAPDTYWVHNLSMRSADGAAIDLDDVGAAFADTFVAVWTGEAENDGFNQLVFSAGATWQEAALLRTLCAYRAQTGQDPSRPVQINALTQHADLARLLLDLFAAKFDPSRQEDLEARRIEARTIHTDIDKALAGVSSLDEDRVLRRLAELIMAVQRTNFYHSKSADTAPAGYVAIKIASQEIDHLPDPKPFREIFMSSPRVDGVHCRFGPVARGGLRWSDRRDDFRTEVLGLVKAQQVKNAVIVPVGSKGGFYPKQLPTGGGRDEYIEAGIAAYREFITALLSITDNLSGSDVTHPNETIIWDGEDPYLVVAADKGTATFSDTANEISLAHDFWLGDAFASGGSAGYDHKKMGITARGGWEAVKRHFREIGKDIQAEPFTVIGVGDMSGDVFGNGMLLSKQIKLQAAFNHLHIFVDPNPEDTESAWKERKRLFDMPRSSWDDYDRELISEGGGVFDRSAKSIALTPELKSLAKLSVDSVTPDELLHALLKADCELLWFGGIGTYVKAESETHEQAGDRANDGLRVNGADIRAKVIGEGANLGATQAGRIEFAQNGGRINTDAIDNSAGVDSSDHEVNIKILCAEAIRRGDLQSEDRNELLASMTEDVGLHVLQHNYDQTGALTLAQSTAGDDHEALERLMVWLEECGVLDRSVEGLPDSQVMQERAAEGEPLTRPELAVLLAWSKIVLFDEIAGSELPEDPYFADTLKAYFPEGIRKFDDARSNHRLRAEIIATVLANRLLDAGGPAFLMRLRELTGSDGAAISRAFEISHAALGARAFADEINALDNKVSADLQTAMHLELAYALSRGTVIAITDDRPVSVQLKVIQPAFEEYTNCLKETLQPFIRGRIEERANSFAKQGAPDDLAERVASLRVLALGPHILMVARDSGRPVREAADAFFTIGHALKLDRLRTDAEDQLAHVDYWDRRATRRLTADLIAQQSNAAIAALEAAGETSGADAAQTWLSDRQDSVSQLLSDLDEIHAGRDWSFAKFSLVADAARSVLSQR